MTLKQLEKRIEQVEGFKVRVYHAGIRRVKRDVRSDKHVYSYPYEYMEMSPGAKISTLRAYRWGDLLPDNWAYKIEVLTPEGKPIKGDMLLENVRRLYFAYWRRRGKA
jgi:hypothetical protein